MGGMAGQGAGVEEDVGQSMGILRISRTFISSPESKSSSQGRY